MVLQKKKVKYDIDSVPPDQIINCVVDASNFVPYSRAINAVKDKCTYGGSWYHNKKSTYKKLVDPFLIVNVEVYSGLDSADAVDSDNVHPDAKASFVLHILNIYTYAFTEEGIWKQFWDCNYEFYRLNERGKAVPFECVPYSMNYSTSGGLKLDTVGLSKFCALIINLHYGRGEQKTNQKTVHRVCFYISESPRYRCYNSFICEGSGVTEDGRQREPKAIPENRLKAYNHWEDLSDFYKSHFFALEGDLEKFPDYVKDMLEDLGLEPEEISVDPVKYRFTELDKILDVLLYKQEDEEVPSKMSKIGCVKPENVQIKVWEANMSKNELVLKRQKFWSQHIVRKQTEDCDSDVWRMIRDIVEMSHKDMTLAAMMTRNAKLRIRNKHMSVFEDENGKQYELKDYVLSDPRKMPK